ncbi:MAG: CoA transferase [Bacteroidota bacterium]
MQQPLFKDMLVIELASVLAGPSVGMFFAEQGARVIKIEHPGTGGDVTRGWKLPSENKASTISAYFSSVNWGKESVVLDLGSTPGQEAAHELIKEASIVITSFLPTTASKLQMSPKKLMELNPYLIVGQISGYGPEEERAAYDAIIQAEAGFTYLNGEAGVGNCKMPVALMDILAAHHLKEAILLAILERHQTGKGKHVEVSLLGAGLCSLANQASNWLVAGHLPEPLGSAHPNIVPYGTVFSCQENEQVILAVGSDKQFLQVGKLLGLTTQTWKTNQQRVQDRAAIEAAIQTKLTHWNRKEFLEACRVHLIPAGAVNRVDQACDLPIARKLMHEAGKLTGFKSLATFEDTYAPISAPPELGAHQDVVFPPA